MEQSESKQTLARAATSTNITTDKESNHCWYDKSSKVPGQSVTLKHQMFLGIHRTPRAELDDMHITWTKNRQLILQATTFAA